MGGKGETKEATETAQEVGRPFTKATAGGGTTRDSTEGKVQKSDVTGKGILLRGRRIVNQDSGNKARHQRKSQVHLKKGK